MGRKKTYGEHLTRVEAGRFMGVSEGAIRYWIANRILEPVVVPNAASTRIPRTALERLKAEAKARGVSVVAQLPRQLINERKQRERTRP